jgi:hypothetical protein
MAVQLGDVHVHEVCVLWDVIVILTTAVHQEMARDFGTDRKTALETALHCTSTLYKQWDDVAVRQILECTKLRTQEANARCFAVARGFISDTVLSRNINLLSGSYLIDNLFAQEVQTPFLSGTNVRLSLIVGLGVMLFLDVGSLREFEEVCVAFVAGVMRDKERRTEIQAFGEGWEGREEKDRGIKKQEVECKKEFEDDAWEEEEEKAKFNAFN